MCIADLRKLGPALVALLTPVCLQAQATNLSTGLMSDLPSSYPIGTYSMGTEKDAPYSWRFDAGVLFGVKPVHANARHLQLISSHTGAALSVRTKDGTSNSWTNWRNVPVTDTSGNLGLGIYSPSFGDVTYGGAHPELHVYNGGSVGSFRPVARFQAGQDGDHTGAAIIINHSNDRGLILEAGRGVGNQAIAHFGLVDNYGGIGRFLTAREGGNVGIGTVANSHKLEVAGTIRAEEVIVEAQPWADYVFEDGYDLKSLAEVESHIEVYGRLPGMPSTAEVSKVGVSIGESQRLLLEKVEELTLHLIEQNRKIEELTAQNVDQQRIIESLLNDSH